MQSERHTISRAFYATFLLAAVIEGISLACLWLGWYMRPGSAIDYIWFGARYAPLIALGFMLGRVHQPYRTAFANTWPFVILWFIFGIATLRIGETPPGWDSEKLRLAQWGYVLASALFLPLAFGAAALGVRLSRHFHRVRQDDPNAA